MFMCRQLGYGSTMEWALFFKVVDVRQLFI